MANFNGQWIQVFTVGRHIDNADREHVIDVDFLERAASNFNPTLHEPPAVIGHPQDNAPAYGWVNSVRVRDGHLEVRFKDTDPAFEEIVKAGRFKKRSASFYVDPETAPGGKAPALRHVGFLGAQPPAVKGLRDIQFTEGETLTFEFSEDSMGLEEKDLNSIVERLKAALGFGGKDKPASFSEADVSRLIAAEVKKATEAVTASFGEQLKQRDSQITELRTQVAQQSGRSTRAEIISFVESLGAANCPPAFRQMGIVEFMEALSGSESKVTVISFSEEGDKKVETRTETAPLDWFKGFMKSLGPFIQFGERFNVLTTTAGAGNEVSPERENELREGAGLPAKGGTQ